MRSIIEELGSPGFLRIRMGVGRPPENTDPADYVLTPFSKEEKKTAGEMVSFAADAVEELITKGLQFAQQKYH